MHYITRITILSAVAAIGCNGAQDDAVECQDEESARNLVPTETTPDWEAEFEYVDDRANPGMERQVDSETEAEEVIKRERIQAWDCLDLAWWNPSGARKVVQIWVDETECTLYERASVEYYDCDSHDGDDDVYRDMDEDGYYATEGDCDDEDSYSYPEGTEICDDIDNNCDGLIDEDLICDQAEPTG